MGSIQEALETAGARDDLQTILQVLEGASVGFNRHETAAGPFASVDTTELANLGLNVRMMTVIKKAQQQQQKQGRFSALRPALHWWHMVLGHV